MKRIAVFFIATILMFSFTTYADTMEDYYKEEIMDEVFSEIPLSFTDVPENAYYYDAVLWAVEKGITTGLSSDSFGPNSTCTRGQIVTFLYRAYTR